MMPSEQPAGFLGSIDQLLFNSTIQTAIQALFLVGAVLMLLGVAIVAVYVWRNFQIKWLYKVGLEAALFFVGIDLGITAYETSYIVHIVHDEKVQITRVSQKLDILSKKLEAQITQETSLKLEALSKTVQETSQTVKISPRSSTISPARLKRLKRPPAGRKRVGPTAPPKPRSRFLRRNPSPTRFHQRVRRRS